MIKATLAKVLTVKVAAICAGAAGVGGVALAAGTGTIRTPLHEGLARASASASPWHHPSGRPSGAPGPDRSGRGDAPPVARLCHDYMDTDTAHRGAALAEKRFRDLVAKSGHKDRANVEKFCDKTFKDWPGARPGGAPKDLPSGRPSAGPSGRPGQPGPGGEQPGNRPDHRPSGLPSAHPSGSVPGQPGH